MQTIYVGIENAAKSGHALRWAIELVESMREPGQIVAVHVLPSAPASLFGLPPQIPPSVDADRHAEAARDLDHLVRQVKRGSSVEVDAQVTEGQPADALLDLAQEADLLVVGARLTGRVLGLLRGSTSQRCVDAGIVPVVIIPHTDRT